MTTTLVERPGAAIIAYAEALLAFLISLQLFGVLLFATGAGLGPVSAIAIVALGLVTTALLCRYRLPGAPGWRVFACAIATILACLLVAAQVYDVSWDGQTYHQAAIFVLGHGWNPIFTPFSDAMLGAEGIGHDSHLWVQHYPKGGWIIQAILYRASGSLQAAKGINIVAILAAFAMLAGAAMRFGLSRRAAILIGLAAALNPIAITQALTFYNDGLAGSLLAILAAALALLAARNDRRDAIAAILALVLVVNLKFSILVIAVIFCIGGAVALFLRHRRASFPVTGLLLASGIVAVILIGWAPYGVNMLHWGHPFYPVMGAHPYDIMWANTPAEFMEIGRGPRFLLGTFGHRTADGTISLVPEFGLKAIAYSGFADARIGGFGILFPFIAALALAMLAMLLRAKQVPRATKGWLLFLLGTLLVSIIVHPEAWWARYVPQLWLIPAMVAGFALAAPQLRALRGAGIALAALMLLDVAASGLGTLRFLYNGNHEIRAEHDRIRRDMHGAIEASVGYWFGPVQRLREAGIKVRILPEAALLSCDKPRLLAASAAQARYCPAPR